MKRLVLVASLVLACIPIHSRGASGAAPGPALGAPPSVASEATAARKELERKVLPLVKSNGFEELDRIAAELRRSKRETASGCWHLRIFYDCLTDLPHETPAKDWEARIQFCENWCAARPNSITARVTLGTLYKQYAWAARGSGYADTVTQQGWILFSARLKKAQATLLEAARLKDKCPVWWDTMQIVALGLSRPLREYDKVFNEAVAFEPRYAFFYFDKSYYLQPRWFGTEGDWQKFASEAGDKLGGEDGDILYARIGWQIHGRRFYDSFVSDSHIDWPRMARGLDLLCKKYPDSLSAASELAYLSYQHQDIARAKPLFERIGVRIDEGVWQGDTAKFFRARNWSLATPAPFATSSAKPLTPVAQPVPLAPASPRQPNDPPAAPADYGGILLKGISGPPTRRLALINDQTVGQGETANVKVGTQKVAVTCIEIKESSAVVLIAGAAKPSELLLK